MSAQVMPTPLILRPPASKEDVDAAEPSIRAAVEEADRILREEGVDAFNEKYGVADTCEGNSNRSTLANNDNNGALEDAIVRGDPRPYQIALLEQAKKANTIVHLGTGQGKTLIALKLIDEYAHELEPDAGNTDTLRKKKQTWFLVPSVALAVQHTQTVRANLPSLTVETACHTASNSEESRRKLASADVVVITHGSALDLLRSYGDIFNLQRVNLLVMDECHNCTGKHGYAQIMNTFFHRIMDATQRPRILGLTASPIINIKKNVTDAGLSKLMDELEHTMDARIFSYAALDDEDGSQMKAVSQDLNEAIIAFDSSSPTFPPPPPFDHLELHMSSREKELKRLSRLYYELGPKATGEYAAVLVKELSRNRYENESREEFERLVSYLRRFASVCEERTQQAYNHGKSNKLQRLEDLLDHQFVRDSDDGSADGSGHVGLLFVERRDTAVALHHYLRKRHREGNSSCIRSDVLVRDASHVFKYTNPKHKLSQREQDELNKKSEEEWLHRVRRIRDVLDGLRSGDINLLVATSIVEEGIDIAACSFVTVFDCIKTTKGYVQMRGRARQQKARFFCFDDVNPAAENPPVRLEKAKEVESAVEEFLRRREMTIMPLSCPPHAVAERIASTSAEVEALRNEEYVTDTARVDLNSSKSLLNRYFMGLPMDDGVRSSKQRFKALMPIYDDEARSLILPSHLPLHVRHVQLPPKYQRGGKKKIQSLLALAACVRLHHHGLLNERLLPLERQDLHDKVMKVALPTVPIITPSKSCIDAPPRAGNDAKTMHLYRLEQVGEMFDQHEEALGGRKRKMGILSVTPVPHIDICLDHESLGDVSVSISEVANVVVSADRWSQSKDFFAATMNARWRRRTSHTHFEYSEEAAGAKSSLYALVALTCDDKIDWDRMRVVISEYNRTEEDRIDVAQRWSNETGWPRLCAPRYDPNVTYICYGDSFKTCTEPFPNQDYASYGDYMLRKRSFRVETTCPLYDAQQLWKLPRKMSRISAVNTFLCTGTDVKKRKVLHVEDDWEQVGNFLTCRGLRTVLLPQSACMEAPLADASLYLHLVLLPQVLYHLQQRLVADAFVRHSARISPRLGGYLKRVNEHSMLEALTAKSCAVDCDYDRLEWLGDAVLKVLHTDALVNAPALKEWTSCLHEGDLSAVRSAMGCNARLQELGRGCGIDNFILTRPLSRGEWAPTALMLKSDEDGSDLAKDVNAKYRPSNRVIADVVEAILGLIYLHFGFDAAQDVAVSLAITLPLPRTDQLVDCEFVCSQSCSPRTARRVSSFLGIDTVLHPSLLIEATTHASCLHHETPSYQRLEWIGDSVLSLAVREHCFNKYPDLDVGSLVVIESTIVSNETLAYLACRERMQDIVRHADSTLPSRIESFFCDLRRNDWGLWTTDPPKVLADVVEAMLGAVHCGFGFDVGQRSALHVVSPILDAISAHVADNTSSGVSSISVTNTMMNPRQVLFEIAPSVKIRTLSEHEYALRFASSKAVWKCGRFADASPNGDDVICYISCCNATLLALSDHSSNAARNRCAGLLASALGKPCNDDLVTALARIASKCRETED